MPFVKVFLQQGRKVDAISAIGDSIHEALVSEAGVPADDRFQVFIELEETQLTAHPTYGGVNRSAELVIVEITLNAGRTVEVKKNLYAAIARNLESRIGLKPDDVMVSLVEVARENWSFGGGRATYA